MFAALTKTVIENKLASTTAILGGLSTLVGFLWLVDAHYAKAADLDTAVMSLTIGQKSISYDLQIQLNKQTIRDLQGKVDDVDDKIANAKKVDPADLNKKKRLERTLEELKSENARLEQEKFAVQNPQVNKKP